MIDAVLQVIMSVMSLAIPEHMADVLDEWGAVSLILEKIILGALVEFKAAQHGWDLKGLSPESGTNLNCRAAADTQNDAE